MKSVLKRKEILTHATTGMNSEGGGAEVTKGQRVYDSIHIRYPKKGNSKRQKVEQRVPEAGGRGQWGTIAY